MVNVLTTLLRADGGGSHRGHHRNGVRAGVRSPATVPGWLAATGIGYAAAALAWCAAITLAGHLWPRATFSKRA